MAKTYTVRFTVRGSGKFPADMLRYDACYPATEGDARAIYTAEWDTAPYDVTVEAVREGKDQRTRHTPERWKSFGWEVVEGPTAVR